MLVISAEVDSVVCRRSFLDGGHILTLPMFYLEGELYDRCLDVHVQLNIFFPSYLFFLFWRYCTFSWRNIAIACNTTSVQSCCRASHEARECSMHYWCGMDFSSASFHVLWLVRSNIETLSIKSFLKILFDFKQCCLTTPDNFTRSTFEDISHWQNL